MQPPSPPLLSYSVWRSIRKIVRPDESLVFPLCWMSPFHRMWLSPSKLGMRHDQEASAGCRYHCLLARGRNRGNFGSVRGLDQSPPEPTIVQQIDSFEQLIVSRLSLSGPITTVTIAPINCCSISLISYRIRCRFEDSAALATDRFCVAFGSQKLYS
jgi:hypothetical protein